MNIYQTTFESNSRASTRFDCSQIDERLQFCILLTILQEVLIYSYKCSNSATYLLPLVDSVSSFSLSFRFFLLARMRQIKQQESSDKSKIGSATPTATMASKFSVFKHILACKSVFVNVKKDNRNRKKRNPDNL